ncbi:MAG: class I SAM-dependent RNA methyltransferase [Eubacteriales bacterium]|nr:class I SAM-dependent RNA methyltransferase [Eubacteriales bacterium]
MNFELMAPCHFGLEACTKKEVINCGCEVTEVTDGRICFSGNEKGLARANMFMRTAERILLKAGEFEARTWDELFEKTRAIEWENYLPWNARFYVAKAASIKSQLFSPRDFQTIIQKAIVKRLQTHYKREGERLPMDGAEYPLRVSAYKDKIVIGIDTSGDSLHKRGYRKLTAKAPITETLAAALIMLTPWKRDRILVDPFCGSGTFLIEAAMMAADIAPGMKRDFTATGWENLIDRKVWYETYDEAYDRAESVSIKDLQQDMDLQGFDIDPDVLFAARKNAEDAGVRELIHFQERDVRDLSHSKKYGFIITNPPYGERLEEKDNVGELYRALGQRFSLLDDWSMYLITGFEDAQKYLGRNADKNRKIYNGMMKTYFLSYMGRKPEKK